MRFTQLMIITSNTKFVRSNKNVLAIKHFFSLTLIFFLCNKPKNSSSTSFHLIKQIPLLFVYYLVDGFSFCMDVKCWFIAIHTIVIHKAIVIVMYSLFKPPLFACSPSSLSPSLALSLMHYYLHTFTIMIDYKHSAENRPLRRYRQHKAIFHNMILRLPFPFQLSITNTTTTNRRLFSFHHIQIFHPILCIRLYFVSE